jgi:hypothetical protein
MDQCRAQIKKEKAENDSKGPSIKARTQGSGSCLPPGK